jgi:hypothetical protein
LESIIRIRWAGHLARIGKKRDANRMQVGKPERKGSVGRPRRSWVHNIKRKDGNGMVWSGLIWLCRALVDTVMNLGVPQNAGKFLSSCTADGLSRRAQLRGVN